MSFLAVMFAAALQAATPDPQAAAAPAAKAEPAKPELVCRMEELVGSRFKKKVCMTADEWKVEELHRERNNRLRHGTIEVGSGR